MTDLSLFNSSEFGEMRTCCDPESGEVWFNLNDVCRALDLSNPSKVISDFPKGLTNSYPLSTNGGIQNATFVNESGLYRTIFKSRKEKALAFQDWVTSEVLPSIRKHGMYATEELLNNPDFAIEVLQRLKNEQEEKKKLQDQMKKDKPKLDYANAILASEGSVLIKELSLLLQKNGINIGPLKLYERMRDKGYTYKVGEMKNLPKPKWIKKGLFTLKKTQYTKGNTILTKTITKVTEKGQQYFLELFMREEGGNLFASVI